MTASVLSHCFFDHATTAFAYEQATHAGLTKRAFAESELGIKVEPQRMLSAARTEFS